MLYFLFVSETYQVAYHFSQRLKNSLLLLGYILLHADAGFLLDVAKFTVQIFFSLIRKEVYPLFLLAVISQV